MTATAIERITDALHAHGSTITTTGTDRATAQCPAHDDHRASLSIGPRKDGKGAVLYCHAGCTTNDIVATIGLTMRDLFDDADMRAVYNPTRDYRYSDGRVVHRKPDKSFPQSGNKTGNALYHIERINPAATVYIPEGEKDVEAIEAIGGYAVTPPQGATKGQGKDPSRWDWRPLSGKKIVIIADRDEAGRNHAEKISKILDQIAADVQIVQAAIGKDAADHIAAGYTLDELVPIISPDDRSNDFDPLDPYYDEPPLDEYGPESTADTETRDSSPIDGYEPVPGFPHQRYGHDNEVPPPTAPADVARLFCSADFHLRLDATEETADRQELDGQYTRRGPKTLISWRGSWMIWRTAHWAELDTVQLRSHVYRTLRNAKYQFKTKDGYELRPWHPDKHKVANVIDAMEAFLHIPAETDPPTWIEPERTNCGELISFTNGLLDLDTRTITEHTPAWFNFVSVPFPYEPDPGTPTMWLSVLKSAWGDDQQSITLLQEYMGYLLSGRTHMQKMLLLIGPTRSGKGTIGRLLRKLLGHGHVAAPTLASLGSNFGLAPLLNKPLAIVSDARLGKETNLVVERLLSITGEDTITVDRKYRDTWTGKLPTRFLILTNEIPKFRDASGAIANRMLVLQMTNSFLGHEDYELDTKLAAELPAILAWALQGLDRLNRQKRFTVPDSSVDAVNTMMDLASPVSAFVRQRCTREPDATVPTDDLYAAWKTWAEDNGHHSGANSTFGRDLRAVVPQVAIINPRIKGVPVRHYAGIRLGLATDEGYPPLLETVNPQVNGHDEGDEGQKATLTLYTNGSVEYCGCGNALNTPQSRHAGKCKPCRDRDMGGYDR